ncbi:uncharacterized protein BDZ83DRAFT_99810 [Colletotrichum acutatum]|uniref:Uncharacterized protein n=1 Tax=Glomerella acutata TaxID=27357 RepID=A0AAD8XI01_GLOAC|nr:uncharacterized protein BDZ83DRAFT_99810 [Colletotrichum acutatum]KAK1728744.1 hypothetical protein BDZ83DRAFT_99810 [Colletotrichum acutatum]
MIQDFPMPEYEGCWTSAAYSVYVFTIQHIAQLSFSITRRQVPQSPTLLPRNVPPQSQHGASFRPPNNPGSGTWGVEGVGKETAWRLYCVPLPQKAKEASTTRLNHRPFHLPRGNRYLAREIPTGRQIDPPERTEFIVYQAIQAHRRPSTLPYPHSLSHAPLSSPPGTPS